MSVPDSLLITRFQNAVLLVARFEEASAGLLGDPALPAVHRRDLKDRLEALAERVRRYHAALKEMGTEPDPLLRAAQEERMDRIFLSELESAIEEGFRFMERRLGLFARPKGDTSPVEADRTLRSLPGEFAIQGSAVDHLGLVAARAAQLSERFQRESKEASRKLDMDLAEVKKKAFLETAAKAGAHNAELLYKAKLAFEKRLRGGQRPALGSHADSDLSFTVLPGEGQDLDAELSASGLRLHLEFRAMTPPALPSGHIEGWIEASGERAVFSLADPRRPGFGAQADGTAYSAFLALYDLKSLHAELLEAARSHTGSGAEASEASTAERLSSALDALL